MTIPSQQGEREPEYRIWLRQFRLDHKCEPSFADCWNAARAALAPLVLEQKQIPELSMSMFATREDYETARKAEAVQRAAIGTPEVAGYITEFGAVGLPVGHPSRVTVLAIHPTREAARKHLMLDNDYNWRIFPVAMSCDWSEGALLQETQRSSHADESNERNGSGERA